MAEYTTTANQGITIPDDDAAFLKSVPDYMKAMAESIEGLVVARFASMAEFTSKVPSPVNGMVFWVDADVALYVYANGTPNRVWPTVPLWSEGATPPTGPGEAGEYYIQTGE